MKLRKIPFIYINFRYYLLSHSFLKCIRYYRLFRNFIIFYFLNFIIFLYYFDKIHLFICIYLLKKLNLTLVSLLEKNFLIKVLLI